jgi:penicillin-binding protein 1B
MARPATGRRSGRRGGAAAAAPAAIARRWPRALATVACLLVAALLLWLIHLDGVITQTFEGRRWSVPAQVFAQPLELFAGRRLSAEQLARELERLGYVRVPRPERPGSFGRSGDSLMVVLRPFRFADGARPARPLRLRFDEDRVVALEGPDGVPVDIVRVEPPLIGSIFPGHGEDRQIVSPEEIPPLLPATLKVVEDRNFDRHHGFDPKAIARAFWVNLRAGAVEQGGSTLTQQLVKSYYLDSRQTLGRKLRELAMAVILERRFSKEELLTAYVNEIYVGQDGDRAVHGFGLASQFYFGKPLAECTPAEIALLVAVIRGPSYYNPYRQPERVRARRDLVLGLMRDFGLIDEAAHGEAVAAPLGVERQARRTGRYYPAFMELVRRQLERDYDGERLASAGFRIFTTLDPIAQDAAEQAVREVLDRLEVARGLPPGELEAAVVVTAPQTGEVVAVVGGRNAGFRGFNRAIRARRPIGSLVKPLVYLAALRDGTRHLGSLVDDLPIVVEDPATGDWTPNNFDEIAHGPVPLFRALADSYNLATVRLGLDVGVEAVAEALGRFLDQPPPEPFPSLLLGAVDLAPLDVARFYGVFADGGFASPLKSIVAVEDQAGARLDRYALNTRQLADPAGVAVVDHALRLVMSHGTGRSSRFAGASVAGKTGTSDGYRDAWFAGFDGAHLAVVWVGYDDNRPTGLTGSIGAMPIWDHLLAALGPSALSLSVPEGFRIEALDYETGLRADAQCGDPVPVPLPSGVRPARKPGCSASLKDLGDRLKQWLEPAPRRTP